MRTNGTTTVLSCGIIGAGIAGLAAAIALRRAGHNVEIFEKSTFKNEIGAAVTLTPNAMRVLHRWGFDAVRAGTTEKEQYRRLDAETLQVLAHYDFSNVREKFGTPGREHAFAAFHRVDLHEGLRAMVRELGVEVQLGREAVRVDCGEGVVRFRDGGEAKKDLLVVADGIKSRFAETVARQPNPAKKTGRSVYRTLIPIDRIMADPLARTLYEKQPSSFCSTIYGKTGVYWMTYPCRSGTEMNFACFHATKPHQHDAEDWNSPATVEDVLGVLDGFHPVLKAVVKCADTMKCYVVGHSEPLPKFNNGKVVVIGDTAHPMQPTHAQGGAMGLEDAAALEVLFSNFNPSITTVTEDETVKRLRLFNQLRLPRGNATLLLSNGMFYNTSENPGSPVPERVREYWSGPFLPKGIEGFSAPIREFFHGYDAFGVAEKAMRFKDEEGGLPEGVIRHLG